MLKLAKTGGKCVVHDSCNMQHVSLRVRYHASKYDSGRGSLSMKSFFLTLDQPSISYIPTLHLPGVSKFVLVQEPGKEAVLICGNCDFDWHYQLVEASVQEKLVPNSISDRSVSGGKIKNGKIEWQSNVYGGVAEEDRAEVANALGVL